jgi:hypothetical protein
MTAKESDTLVVTHGHCFDGLCSAVAFVRLLEHVQGPSRVSFFAATYGPDQNGVKEARLSGKVNAILDYRFTASDRLTWYFDHHRTAFASPEDRATFDAHAGGRYFHDARARSCAGLIAKVGAETFSMNVEPLASIVRWADLIDSADFPSAEWAVECKEPVMRLAKVVEHAGDSGFLSRMVPRLLAEPIEEVARSEEIERAYAPLDAQSRTFVDKVRAHGSVRGDVVLVDLGDDVVEIASKFAPYAIFPELPYSVVLTRAPGRCKISVGYNPWSSVPRRHDISAICKRHGGGGHAVVGAVTIPEDVERARKLALEIADELSA